ERRQAGGDHLPRPGWAFGPQADGGAVHPEHGGGGEGVPEPDRGEETGGLLVAGRNGGEAGRGRRVPDPPQPGGACQTALGSAHAYSGEGDDGRFRQSGRPVGRGPGVPPRRVRPVNTAAGRRGRTEAVVAYTGDARLQWECRWDCECS